MDLVKVAHKIKVYPRTVSRKVGHKAKYFELVEFINELEEDTNV